MWLELNMMRGRYNRAFGTGFARGLTRTLEDVLTDKRAQKLRKQFNLDRDLLQEHEDERDTGSLVTMIENDPSLTPEEKQQHLAAIPANEKGKRIGSKEQRELVKGQYEGTKKSKSDAASTAAKEEKAKADKAAAAKMKYDALKMEAEALGPEAKKSLAGYMAASEPNDVMVDRFEKAIEREYVARNKTPDKPNETDTKIGLVKKATEIGGGDPYKGWKIIKEQDPTTYYEAQQRGIKTEPEDKVSPKAEKLLEDVTAEWQYEKDQYTAQLTKAQKDDRVTTGKMTPEQVVMEAGISDPGPITLFAFKYLGDRKGYMNEEAANEAFKRLATQTPEGKEAMGSFQKNMEGIYGKPAAAAASPTAPQAGSSTSGGAPTGTATVTAGQESSLIAEEERWKKLLEAAEAKYGIKQ